MRPDRNILLFVLWSIVLSVAIGWVLWTVPTLMPSGTAYTLRNSMFLIPAVSVMIAARGFGWKRKLTYAVLTFAVFELADMVAAATGLIELSAKADYTIENVLTAALVVLYTTFVVTYPLVALLFFVGKRPALLWSKGAR